MLRKCCGFCGAPFAPEDFRAIVDEELLRFWVILGFTQDRHRKITIELEGQEPLQCRLRPSKTVTHDDDDQALSWLDDDEWRRQHKANGESMPRRRNRNGLGRA